MRVAIDASRTTRARQTGTEAYALHLIRALIRLNDSRPNPHRLILYFRDAPSPELFPSSPHVDVRVIPIRRLWTQLGFAAALRRDPPDVTWVPAHGLPLWFPGQAVVTVHDVGYRRFPNTHPLRQRVALELYTRYSVARAAQVMVDSQMTGWDVARYYGTPDAKIRLVYPGVSIPRVGDIATVRAKYRLPARYWLYLGTLQPRKNIQRIVAAYHLWRQAHPNDGAGLVLAGGEGWKFRADWPYDANIHMTGYVDEADKGALYAGALGFVFPSLYEGFGFPVIEAFGVGIPVICSNTSSLPELAGEAALRVNPLEVGEIAAAMTQISTATDAQRAAWIQAGRAQAARFTWESAAWGALQTIEAAARR
ncbi:MAG: glycosyltransferase family 4 protein [Phototrophicaceae bacterium]|jgi:glycosyltransferase involved in cell wall biosynthesis